MIRKIFEKYPVIKHMILAGLFLFGVILLTLLWLRFYTNHGQKIKMPNFVDMHIDAASRLANNESFTIVIEDSTFVVGQPGGIILHQNPEEDAEVKSGRKVYVNTTKYIPDVITVGNLPFLYGNDFRQKMVELGYLGLTGKVRSRKYDASEPNSILEVYYKGNLIISSTVKKSNVKINKGDELEFVVSDKESGEFVIPLLTNCGSLGGAEFILERANLSLGSVTQDSGFDENGDKWVINQNPAHDGISKIPMQSPIDVTISNIKPSECL